MCGRWLVGVVVAVALGLAPGAQAAVKTVNFDDLAVGTTVDTQYAASAGVTFPGQTDYGYKPVIRSAPSQATSGTQVADFNTCEGGTDACGEFRPALTRGRLSASATKVSVNVGYLDTGHASTAPVQLRAFDAGGTLLDTDDATVTENGPFTTMTVEGTNIAYFDLYADSAYQLAMDDLAITYPDAPPPLTPAYASARSRSLSTSRLAYWNLLRKRVRGSLSLRNRRRGSASYPSSATRRIRYDPTLSRPWSDTVFARLRYAPRTPPLSCRWSRMSVARRAGLSST